MIANTQPLYYIPHDGAALPWHSYHPAELTSPHHDEHSDLQNEVGLDVIQMRTNNLVEAVTVVPLSYADHRAPGLLLVANSTKLADLVMDNMDYQHPEHEVSSFAESLFHLFRLS